MMRAIYLAGSLAIVFLLHGEVGLSGQASGSNQNPDQDREQRLGAPQDYSAALRFYRAAADQGNAHAQTRMGLFYEKGWAVPLDQVEAIRWYRLAAEQGDAEGQR